MDAKARTPAWRYFVCGLLLLATTINYCDRQTLANMGVRITQELALTNEQYGRLELAFGWAFAAGSSFFGWLADRRSIRWLYPSVLVLWSLMGFCTGLTETYLGLIVCRTLLGFFEAGHWPCAIRTTRRILEPAERTLGNSILQSGSSVGAIITPLLVLGMLTREPGSWRSVFQVIGVAGLGWAGLWLAAVRRGDLHNPRDEADEHGGPGESREPGSLGGLSSPARRSEHVERPAFWQVVLSRRLATLLLVTISINACWHIFRVWLVKFLVEGRGFSESQALYFNSAYNVATDVGCIAAGLLSVWLVRQGWRVHRARVAVFSLCALLTATSVAIPWLPTGWPLTVALMLVAAGSLGLFPAYYSFSQDLSVEHQGKITGLLGTTAWATISPIHSFFGWVIDRTHSYEAGMMLAGLCPLVGVAALLLVWDDRPAALQPAAEASL